MLTIYISYLIDDEFYYLHFLEHWLSLALSQTKEWLAVINNFGGGEPWVK